ncbi:radical SAM protein [Tistrella sp. BH-R2-4]|uniref:Radical SAM protein n=1 Tax=Tistrella arctica TaxID=3133430 RepID=A0ABU9YMM4_9PROT
MKRVLLTTAPKEALVEMNGIGGNWYDRTDTYMAWTCANDLDDRLSVTCPPTGLNFLKANVPDVELLEYPTWAEYEKALASEQWDMVGISFYTWSVPVAIQMAKLAREYGVKDVWGGNYGAITPGIQAHFDRLIKGPGEYVLHQYVYGRPLERVEHPPMMGYSSFRGVSSPVGYLYSKRGCNIGCTFCSTPVFNPKEDAIFMEDMERALDAYKENNVAHVIIYDESFFLKNDIAERVVDGLAKRGLGWICLTRADLLRGRIEELTDRGMDGAIIGIESYRDKNIADVQKRDDVYNVRATVRELIKNGRRALGTFMVGFPDDSIEDMEYDITQLADEGLFACQLTLLTPFHGTKLWKQMEHLVTETDLSKFDLYNLVWNHAKMSPSEARDLMAWAQRKVNDPDVVAQKIKQDMKDKLRREMAAKRGVLPVGSRPSRLGLGGGMAAGAFAAPNV